MKHMVLVIHKTVVGPLLAQRGGENAERIVNQPRPFTIGAPNLWGKSQNLFAHMKTSIRQHLRLDNLPRRQKSGRLSPRPRTRDDDLQ